uniref:Uncharacterized protein n=1 Tax=Meloidogyne hapla TaxID=6305 RepID=A0A1I8B8C3_MELHA
MELELLKNFTIIRLHVKLNLPEEEFQQWLKDLKMLRKKRTCDCGNEMRKEIRQNYGRWVCRKSKCRKTKGALLSKAFEHVFKQKREIDFKAISNENVTFRFYCKHIAGSDGINLLSNRKNAMSWYATTSYTPARILTEVQNPKTEGKSHTKFFEEGKEKAFELNIIANKIGNMTKYKFEINGEIYDNNTIITDMPTWKIDQFLISL